MHHQDRAAQTKEGLLGSESFGERNVGSSDAEYRWAISARLERSHDAVLHSVLSRT